MMRWVEDEVFLIADIISVLFNNTYSFAGLLLHLIHDFGSYQNCD